VPLSTRMPLVRRLSLEEPTKLMARIKLDYLWSGLKSLFAELTHKLQHGFQEPLHWKVNFREGDLAAAQRTSGGTIIHCYQELPKGY
jgi:hypothetical protein